MRINQNNIIINNYDYLLFLKSESELKKKFNKLLTGGTNSK